MMLRAAFVPPAEATHELRALLGRLSLLPGVRPLPADRLEVPIAAMGNVSEADARRLARRLGQWSDLAVLPEVRWSGIELLAGGELVARLVGDVAGLDATVRAVGASAERIHVFVDRRAFSASAVLAKVDQQQPGSRVGTVLAGLADWQGASTWAMSEIALLRIRWIEGQAVSEVVERISIATHAAALSDRV